MTASGERAPLRILAVAQELVADMAAKGWRAVVPLDAVTDLTIHDARRRGPTVELLVSSSSFADGSAFEWDDAPYWSPRFQSVAPLSREAVEHVTFLWMQANVPALGVHIPALTKSLVDAILEALSDDR
jgi:hypothetical protein